MRKCIGKFVEEGKLGGGGTGIPAGLNFISKLKHDINHILILGVVSTYSLKSVSAGFSNELQQ